MNCIALLLLLLCGGNQGRCADTGKDQCAAVDCLADREQCRDRERDCHADKREDCRMRETEQECGRNRSWERTGSQERCECEERQGSQECRDTKSGMTPPPWNNRSDIYEAGRQNGCGCEERE